MVTDRISEEGNAVGSVRLFVSLFSLCFLNLDILYVHRSCMTLAALRVLKVKVKVRLTRSV